MDTCTLDIETYLNLVPQVRLVGGNGVTTGHVEVYYYNTWGTVFRHGWDLNDATVVCRELGFPGAISSSCCAAVRQGNRPIWLYNVQCTGNETSLSSCSHELEGSYYSFYYSYDAGVSCQGEYDRVWNVFI